jgi:hypothetical protein
MATVYVMCIRPAVGLGAARRERDRVFRRRPFSTKRGFLATITSQRLAFRALPLCRYPLMRRVILPALIAPLVSGIREPMARGLFELAAISAAVALPSVIRSADEEPAQASPAAQLEDHEFVHDREGTKQTGTPGPTTAPCVLLAVHEAVISP